MDEIPLYPPAGEGTHTFVRVEKRLRTTEEVARLLAARAGVRAADVGYAGRKDRIAVARQWFSVPGLAPDAACSIEAPGLRVLEAHRHPHRLRTGQLRGNRFVVRLRDVGPARAERLAARLATLERRGVPNRFGAQRFGRDGANAERARALLDDRTAPGDRRAARFLLSALQAEVFNAVLARRPVPLDALEAGDLAVVHASGGLFRVEDLATEERRAAVFEISATGPIFGTRMRSAGGAVGEREAAVLRELGIPGCGALRAPHGIRLRGGRRPVRIRPDEVSLWSEPGPRGTPDAVLLGFTLPAGSYATVLLEELARESVDG